MNISTSRKSPIEALDGSRSFYDLLAALYFKPLTSDQIDNFEKTDLSPYAQINERFADGVNGIVHYLKKRNTGTRQELAVDFTGSFGGMSTWEGRSAVPCESVFTSEEGLLYQDAYHEVHTIYRAHGVKRIEGFDYPDDHLSLMFEYLGTLFARIARDIERGEYTSAAELVESSDGFIRRHILEWFNQFEEVALHLVTTRFYRGVLKMTRGFLEFELELLADFMECLHEAQRQDAVMFA